jgi:hypothetical protein
MLHLDYETVRRLVDQAQPLALYLIEHDVRPSDPEDDRSALEVAADYVANLAGYHGGDEAIVSGAIWRGLHHRLDIKEGCLPRPDQMPEWTP